MIGSRLDALSATALRRWVRAFQLAIVSLTLALLVALVRPAAPWQPPVLNESSRAPETPEKAAAPLDLAAIAKRNLRQPPFDPPPPAASPVTPEAPPSIRLAGTAIEADRRFAVFALPDNNLTVREIGATVSGYEVIAIERGSAKVRRGGRDYELRVPWFDRISAETASTARGAP